MPKSLIQVNDLLSARNIRPQVMEAVRQLKPVLGKMDAALGYAYDICNIWQSRFELALRSEIPDWVGLAGFRCITDFTIPSRVLNNIEELKKIFPSFPDQLETEECPKDIGNPEECWRGFLQYFEEKRDLHSGKFQFEGDAEKHFLDKINQCDAVLGGQAGNILWLWRCIGVDCVAYVPFFAKALADLCDKTPELGEVQLVRIENETVEIRSLKEMKAAAGIRSDALSDRVGAPSGGSIIMFKDGRRLIYQFVGFRDLEMRAGDSMPWQAVQFYYQNKPLMKEPLEIESGDEITWPGAPFFCECYIDKLKVLHIRLAGDDEMRRIGNSADFAILGGIDAIFFDKWLCRYPTLQAKLLDIGYRQLKALATNGVRLGIEISGFPHRDYAVFLKNLCRDEVIVALGINGIDELPDVVGEKILENNPFYELWFEPDNVDNELQAEVNESKAQGDHFEYITYLRAKHLAEVMGVRTLYVHTMTLDLILRKNADPGALLRAQLGDMMGKGLVIAALLRRVHGEDWKEEIRDKITPAVKPEAMLRLGQFAAHFEKFEKKPRADDRMLKSGIWLAPTPNEYSLAVAPVMWPHEESVARDLNTTGSGDMTFGAFFFLGGV
jgi:hypothetical protein